MYPYATNDALHAKITLSAAYEINNVMHAILNPSNISAYYLLITYIGLKRDAWIN